MKTKNVSRLLILATVAVLTAPMAYAQTTTTSGFPNTRTAGASTTSAGVNYNESSSSTLNGTLNSGRMNSSGVINGNGSNNDNGATDLRGADTVTPGVPNTGSGGESTANFLVLFISGVGMIASIMLLKRKLAR